MGVDTTKSWFSMWLVLKVGFQVWFISFRWIMQWIYYGKCVRHLALIRGEHIGISPLTNKREQPRKYSAFCHHLLNCNYSSTFQDFSVLCHENKKYLLELHRKPSYDYRYTISESKRTFRPSLCVWMSTYHIVCCTLWTSLISFLLILRNVLDLKKNCKF